MDDLEKIYKEGKKQLDLTVGNYIECRKLRLIRTERMLQQVESLKKAADNFLSAYHREVVSRFLKDHQRKFDEKA